MINTDRLTQFPPPGTRHILFRGDTCTFSLSVPRDEKGDAWLRTNIGQAHVARQEIIREVLYDEPPLGRYWFDIPMKRSPQIRDDMQHFQVTLPCSEVGHSEAKCYFLRENQTDPLWPPGANTVINVEPADTCCANIIYNTFVRQFGPNKKASVQAEASEQQCIQSLDKLGYTVIPKSGTFRDLITELDFIIGELGCTLLQLLPVHPTPTTYARMGRFGSPYASLSFTEVDPGLAQFDPKATPLEQFMELVEAIHARSAKIIIDIAINHTGWAARLHETHPEWLIRGDDGRIEVPGAWGVRWEDLTKLDYTHKDLWQYMADVFLTWCRRGVDGFRCDAGYMIPLPAWQYIIACVREQYPDTIFFLEGLGGKISVTRDLLNRGNFNWAYSELFQNYDRGQIENYLPEALEISQTDGITVHFAETHDNNRLAERSESYAKMRTALCALCSPNGGFGFANGVEWYAKEKIVVHECPSLNWGANNNQVQHIRRLSTLLRIHPAFHDHTKLEMIQQGEGNHIALLRRHLPTGKKLLILANLDDKASTACGVRGEKFPLAGVPFLDLLTEKAVSPTPSKSDFQISLEPEQIVCLTSDSTDMDQLRTALGHPENRAYSPPDRIRIQQLRTKALDVFLFYHKIRNQGLRDMGNFDLELAIQHLEENPLEYCRSLNPFSEEPRVITWQWPRDAKREVMIPPDHFLLVRADTAFRARIMDGNRTLSHEESLRCTDGSFFTLFQPLPVPAVHTSFSLRLWIHDGEQRREDISLFPLLFLSLAADAEIKQVFHRGELLKTPLLFLGTNGRGGMLRANASWGKLNSRYDALLAANLHPDFPEDRWIMLTRCRAWVVFQGYSAELALDCLHTFRVDEHSRGIWEYHVPTGQGEYVCLSITMEMIPGENAMQVRFSRGGIGADGSASGCQIADGKLPDDKPVRLILRPDIEDRNFHETTKAYLGPEHNWPKCVESHSDGFTFTPAPNRQLQVRIFPGTFSWEPEWQYMVHRPMEVERGLDPDSDMFSPGYFSAFLKGGECVAMNAGVGEEGRREGEMGENVKSHYQLPILNSLVSVLDHFVVRRESLNTVIAGYPWFLDWGRDTLIFVRGLIAAGRTEDARAILKQFGRFEKDGTLPNMIRGNDAGNRDTSDALLWFFVACSDLVNAEGNDDFLNVRCNGRTMLEIFISMIRSLMSGTPNGIRMDPESGLIFSPAHFTWMDTNYPAGTPREGYPIEIQAFWHFALSFISQKLEARSQASDFKLQISNLAQKVQSSIMEFFFLEKERYLSDCLHARAGVPANQATPDDALRPNQLFALTLSAVTDTAVCRRILAACEELLVPGAIRSLGDWPVHPPLEIRHHGRSLNDPHHPYQGTYAGDEDTERKPAYHNGTAWTWVFPSFCEAWVRAYGDSPAVRDTALSWLTSSTRIINTGCVGHVPEILDGDYPHTQRGCDAQAWGASELFRVWKSSQTDHSGLEYEAPSGKA
ncbi:MAG: glycogen debranching protein [Desulfobacteraceae bacterium 4572_88]|nr:MAG: glycogen debranching protein [Desulfobacteraceae bacterium 4572_88]